MDCQTHCIAIAVEILYAPKCILIIFLQGNHTNLSTIFAVCVLIMSMMEKLMIKCITIINVSNK